MNQFLHLWERCSQIPPLRKVEPNLKSLGKAGLNLSGNSNQTPAVYLAFPLLQSRYVYYAERSDSRSPVSKLQMVQLYQTVSHHSAITRQIYTHSGSPWATCIAKSF